MIKKSITFNLGFLLVFMHASDFLFPCFARIGVHNDPPLKAHKTGACLAGMLTHHSVHAPAVTSGPKRHAIVQGKASDKKIQPRTKKMAEEGRAVMKRAVRAVPVLNAGPMVSAPLAVGVKFGIPTFLAAFMVYAYSVDVPIGQISEESNPSPSGAVKRELLALENSNLGEDALLEKNNHSFQINHQSIPFGPRQDGLSKVTYYDLPAAAALDAKFILPGVWVPMLGVAALISVGWIVKTYLNPEQRDCSPQQNDLDISRKSPEKSDLIDQPEPVGVDVPMIIEESNPSLSDAVNQELLSLENSDLGEDALLENNERSLSEFSHELDLDTKRENLIERDQAQESLSATFVGTNLNLSPHIPEVGIDMSQEIITERASISNHLKEGCSLENPDITSLDRSSIEKQSESENDSHSVGANLNLSPHIPEVGIDMSQESGTERASISDHLKEGCSLENPDITSLEISRIEKQSESENDSHSVGANLNLSPHSPEVGIDRSQEIVTEIASISDHLKEGCSLENPEITLLGSVFSQRKRSHSVEISPDTPIDIDSTSLQNELNTSLNLLAESGPKSDLWKDPFQIDQPETVGIGEPIVQITQEINPSPSGAVKRELLSLENSDLGQDALLKNKDSSPSQFIHERKKDADEVLSPIENKGDLAGNRIKSTKCNTNNDKNQDANLRQCALLQNNDSSQQIHYKPKNDAGVYAGPNVENSFMEEAGNPIKKRKNKRGEPKRYILNKNDGKNNQKNCCNYF